MAISGPRFDFIDRLRAAHETDPALRTLRDELTVGQRPMPRSLVDNLVAFSGRLYILPVSPLLHELLAVVHEDGHEGVQRTLHRLRRDFHSTNMRVAVQDFVRACDVCQRNKSEYLHPAGRLLPLSVPTSIWADVDLDFVEALPRINGKSVIPSWIVSVSTIISFRSLTRTRRSQWRMHSSPRSSVYTACRSPWSPSESPCSPRRSGGSSGVSRARSYT